MNPRRPEMAVRAATCGDQHGSCGAQRLKGAAASLPVSRGTTTTPAGPGAGVVRWVALGLAGIVLLAIVWIWRERALAPPVPATLHDCRQGAAYTVSKRVFRVGKAPYRRLRRNDLVIPEATVSRGHAKIQYRNGAFYVRDDGSRNHTYITRKNEKGETVTRRVEDRAPEKLENGDIIRFDAYEFRFGAAPERVQRAVARDGTQAAPDESDDYGSGTVPPGPKTEAKAREARPQRQETIPPAGLTETCLKCEGAFAVDLMTTWRDFRLCATCESDIQALPTEQAESLRRELDKKKRRRANTVGIE